jgi:protein TonB
MNEKTLSLPAWGVSLALHGGAVWLAILFTAQVKPLITEEIFKWDVALIEPVKTDATSEPMPQPAPMEQAVSPVQPQPRVTASRPVEPPPDPVMHRVAPQQTAQMVHPQSQPTKPVEQREDPLPLLKTEPVTPPVNPVREKTAEPIEQPVVEAPKMPEPTTVAKEPEPVRSVEPLVTQQQPVAPPPSEPAISRTVETPATPSLSEPVASSSAVEPPPTTSSPSPQEAPVQVAKAAPSGPEAKIDHRWIAESLWRRVAELKRYPSSARLNGQEGKVVLKAVIRSDGHLAEVTVQKSSGHQILDAAAIEAVKLACPLHMKHAIGKPEIVVSLPIVYSLAN